MKKTILIALMALIGLSAFAQSAQQVLDRTAKVIGNKSGASANFTISNAKIGSSSGTIAIKGNKFNARTPQAIVWFNGKTQWSYLKKTNEVNISTPTQAQQNSKSHRQQERCKRQLHHIKCENRFEQRHYCHQRKQIQCPYATSYRMVQRKDSMVISEEDQRGKHLYPNPGSTDGNESLYLY